MPRFVLDIGAGAGGNLGVLRSFLSNSLYVGCELSVGMIMASSSDIEWVNCSGTHLPIRPGSMDLVISISTLHHIPKSLIGNALRGVHEALRPGGLFIATVWGCDKATLRRLRPIGDCEGYITWSYGIDRGIARYYRLYREGELEHEVSSAGFIVVRSGVVRVGGFINYYVVSRK
ncbi:class I SAM-dependent methyltransferase [Vulcanisaeta sp. JCM 16161]|uniref:class I SAM-dependent methyltransferase n=1 Tax=Vulcanisaeta sp. JCM 16161 TaxID=1295372 RepID=UPI0006D075F5|nr:class I SAM-dependent methyltransferase [Vulcanisaeta sp. JCM 16161]